jgi:hypothetical protein
MQENCITIQLRLPGVKVLDVKEDRCQWPCEGPHFWPGKVPTPAGVYG